MNEALPNEANSCRKLSLPMHGRPFSAVGSEAVLLSAAAAMADSMFKELKLSE